MLLSPGHKSPGTVDLVFQAFEVFFRLDDLTLQRFKLLLIEFCAVKLFLKILLGFFQILQPILRLFDGFPKGLVLFSGSFPDWKLASTDSARFSRPFSSSVTWEMASFKGVYFCLIGLAALQRLIRAFRSLPEGVQLVFRLIGGLGQEPLLFVPAVPCCRGPA